MGLPVSRLPPCRPLDAAAAHVVIHRTRCNSGVYNALGGIAMMLDAYNGLIADLGDDTLSFHDSQGADTG